MEYKFKVGDHVTKSSKLPPFLNGDLVALKGEKDLVGYVYTAGIKNGYVTVSKIVTMYGESKFGDYAIEDLVLVPEVTQKQEVKSEGIKFDSDKLQWWYLWQFLPELEQVAYVLQYGDKKYPAEDGSNWKRLDSLERRASSAAMRHLSAYLQNDKQDNETNKSHLAHAITNLLFLMHKDRQNANPA